ncbi:hypothetical protein ACROYT_G005801 [Oculina patagonica]
MHRDICKLNNNIPRGTCLIVTVDSFTCEIRRGQTPANQSRHNAKEVALRVANTHSGYPVPLPEEPVVSCDTGLSKFSLGRETLWSRSNSQLI